MLEETPTRMFFCEYCEIFKNSFFYRTRLVAASERINEKHKRHDF